MYGLSTPPARDTSVSLPHVVPRELHVTSLQMYHHLHILTSRSPLSFLSDSNANPVFSHVVTCQVSVPGQHVPTLARGLRSVCRLHRETSLTERILNGTCLPNSGTCLPNSEGFLVHARDKEQP